MSKALKKQKPKARGKERKKMGGQMRVLNPNPIVHQEGLTSRKNIICIFIPVIGVQMERREEEGDRNRETERNYLCNKIVLVIMVTKVISNSMSVRIVILSKIFTVCNIKIFKEI